MTWLPWLLLAVSLFWCVGAYNRLVRLRFEVVRCFGALDTFLVRWIALLGDYQAALGAVVTATAAADAHAAVQAATTQFGASLAVARARPLDGSAMAALATGAQVLDAAWRALVAAPQGADGEVPADLTHWTRERESLRQQCVPAQSAFSEAVRQYNLAVGQFPASVLAWLFGFRKTQGL